MRPELHRIVLAAAAVLLVAACLTGGDRRRTPQHAWWRGLGPVLPHETFPADCRLCHVGDDWQTLVPDFEFDHAQLTGVPLVGAHQFASCLRCHNDRGPVEDFQRAGCAGCHEDIHAGQLGSDCESCHNQRVWRPEGQIELHLRTRFPLSGVHASTACRRCHPGAEVGKFVPTDVECLTCHQDDLARAVIPPHANLGWTFDCDACHVPTSWDRAELDPNF